MNFLVIDGAQDKIVFFSNFNNNSYHKTIKASKDNNEKFSMELFNFFDENSIKPRELNPYKFNLFVKDIALATAIEVLIPENFPGP